MAKRHFVTADKDLNPDLANQVATLRGGIVGQANKMKKNDKFTYELSVSSPEARITNNENGKSTIVPLYAYGDVIKVLNELF